MFQRLSGQRKGKGVFARKGKKDKVRKHVPLPLEKGGRSATRSGGRGSSPYKQRDESGKDICGLEAPTLALGSLMDNILKSV